MWKFLALIIIIHYFIDSCGLHIWSSLTILKSEIWLGTKSSQSCWGRISFVIWSVQEFPIRSDLRFGWDSRELWKRNWIPMFLIKKLCVPPPTIISWFLDRLRRISCEHCPQMFVFLSFKEPELLGKVQDRVMFSRSLFNSWLNQWLLLLSLCTGCDVCCEESAGCIQI